MSIATAEAPRLLHAVPGRARINLPDWSGSSQRQVEAQIRKLPGVKSVQANSLTGNVLVKYDPSLTNHTVILWAASNLNLEATSEPDHADDPPPAHVERLGRSSRARIAVRGLDRNPRVAKRVVQRLASHPGVKRVTASPLTGRVLVEYDEHEEDIDDLISEVSGMELPDTIGEDRPSYPLDPKPLIQCASRLIGATAGLSFLALRRAIGSQGTFVAGAAEAAAVIGLLQGFPLTRNWLRALLGRNAADFAFSGAGIVSLTLSGSPLGLTMAGAGALRLFTEVKARRTAWKSYQARIENAAPAQAGDTIRLEAGERTPLGATVVEGAGTAIGLDGMPVLVSPGQKVSPGSRLYGGPFRVTLGQGASFTPQPRPVRINHSLYDRYGRAVGVASLGYAALTGLITRSFSRAFAALLLVNPRTALIGKEGADTSASARVIRSGVTVVGTRPDREVRLPGVLLVDSPRVLTDGWEIASTLPLENEHDLNEVLNLASGVAAAAGSPWGGVFPSAGRLEAEDGAFDGRAASATFGNDRYTLRPVEALDALPESERMQHRGEHFLRLQRDRDEHPLAIFALRPKLAPGALDLISASQHYGVRVELLSPGDSAAAQSVARRAGIRLTITDDTVQVIRARQIDGHIVALLSDSARSAPGFAACDLAVGLSSGRSRFPARADLLAPDLAAVRSVLDAGVRHDLAVRDSVALSVASDLFGSIWGFQGQPGLERAGNATYVTALSALALGCLRLMGGEPARSSIARLTDPRPERWGRRGIADTLRALNTSESGLTREEAASRRRTTPARVRRSGTLAAIVDQLRSPLTAILASAAALSFMLGSVADVAVIAAVIAANATVGVWQERQAGQAAQALGRLSASIATVLRDGEPVSVPANEVVPGDVLVLASGDRVAADARLLSAQGLEVDEAALTGESMPVVKSPDASTDFGRVVLEGSDTTVGTGRAVVVGVGSNTRMGATAAALSIEETKQSPLGARLNTMLKQVLPLAAGGGVIVCGSGLLWGKALLPQLAVGATIALAAVPEGLPLLAGVAEAAVARRLADRRALVRRLTSVEALGRVDVVCTDKTGTLTEGHLALTLVMDADHVTEPPSPEIDLGPRHVLLTAALASPSPDASDAGSHPTDVAVLRGAEEAGLADQLRIARDGELAFDPVRAFHATRVGGRLCVKGAPEVLTPRCASVRNHGQTRPLDDAGRRELLAEAKRFAEQGLRVLMVAEGPAETGIDDPEGLTALGFLGISDPLRPGVPSAVRRCREAGVRVIMLTGDHPDTAHAIAHEAGLLSNGDGVLTAAEIMTLEDDELARRLESAVAIARITPLDKLRIVESLQRHGHTVAMTGDGVNDAPALRLAEVGVAMGRGGTEVARQAADVVLADDDFTTLVEALVEGRGFWRNIRRSIGLLLGGNLGELGLMVGASVLGLATPLTARQILAVNLLTDVLPAVAVALQQPERRDLAGLAREGTSGLGTPLRNAVLRRGSATAVPALAGYFMSLRSSGLAEARSVAFAGIVATQLAQTLDMGRTGWGLSKPVLGAVAGSAALLAATLMVSPLSAFLGLAAPGPMGWAIIGGASLVAIIIGRGLPEYRLSLPRPVSIPALGANAVGR